MTFTLTMLSDSSDFGPSLTELLRTHIKQLAETGCEPVTISYFNTGSETAYHSIAVVSRKIMSPVMEALGATTETETEALERIMILQGVATGQLFTTPPKRHYAVHSVSGAHVGLWPMRETAVEVLRDYPGGTLTELYEAQHG